MKLQLIELEVANFKGATFTEQLALANMLVGDNYVGKSTRMEAIRLGLVGYLRELGKTNEATFGLSTGVEMMVWLTFSDGTSIRRTWTAKGNSVVAGKSFTGPSADLLRDNGELAVMLDAQEYFALTDTARVNYVYQLINLGTAYTVAGLIERLTTSLTTPADLLPADERAPLIELIDAVTTPVDDYSPQDFVEAAAQLTAENWKEAKDYAKRMEETIRGLSALREGDAPGPIMSALQRDKAELEREILTVTEQRGQLLGQYTAIRSARTRRAAIQRDLGHGQKAREQLAAFRETLRLVAADRLVYCPISQTILQDNAVNVQAHKSKLKTLETLYKQAVEAETLWEQKIVELRQMTACPCCGAKGEGWKNAKIEEYNQAALVDVQTQGKYMIEIDTVKASLLVADAQLTKSNTEQNRAIALANKEREVLANIAAIEPGIARLTALEEELAGLTPENPEIEQEVETLQARINVLQQNGRDNGAKIEQLQGRQSELGRLAEAEKMRDKAKADQTRAKAVGEALRALQAEMVGAAFGPLLERANSLFGAVLATPLAYKAGEIGTWRGTGWVGHKTFTGAEKALTYAAMQASLAMQAPFRIMMIDEMGRFAPQRLGKILDAVMQAVMAGQLDGFIGIDVGRLDYYRACKNELKLSDEAFLVREIK